MSHSFKLLFAAVLLTVNVPAQTAGPDGPAKPLVLQKNEGEYRARRPREGFSSPSSEFLLKIGPKTSGSKHLLLLPRKFLPAQQFPNTNTTGRRRSC